MQSAVQNCNFETTSIGNSCKKLLNFKYFQANHRHITISNLFILDVEQTVYSHRMWGTSIRAYIHVLKKCMIWLFFKDGGDVLFASLLKGVKTAKTKKKRVYFASP